MTTMEIATTAAAQEAITAMNTALLPVQAFTLDVSADAVRGAQTVQVPVITAGTPVTTENNYESATGVTIVKKDVTLGDYYVTNVDLTDVDREKLESVDYMRGLLEQCFYDVGKSVAVDVMNDITVANYPVVADINPAYTGDYADFDKDDVADIRAKCNKSGFTMGGRSLCLNSDYAGGILKSVSNADLYGDDRPIKLGDVPMVHGFRMIESENIPGNSQDLVGFAAERRAMAIAIRPPEPDRSLPNNTVFSIITEPQTNLSVGLRLHYSDATGKTWLSVDCRYGKAVVQPGALLRITSA